MLNKFLKGFRTNMFNFSVFKKNMYQSKNLEIRFKQKDSPEFFLAYYSSKSKHYRDLQNYIQQYFLHIVKEDLKMNSKLNLNNLSQQNMIEKFLQKKFTKLNSNQIKIMQNLFMMENISRDLYHIKLTWQINKMDFIKDIDPDLCEILINYIALSDGKQLSVSGFGIFLSKLYKNLSDNGRFNIENRTDHYYFFFENIMHMINLSGYHLFNAIFIENLELILKNKQDEGLSGNSHLNQRSGIH